MKEQSSRRIALFYIISLFPGLVELASSIGIWARELWERSLVSPPIYTWVVIPSVPKIQLMAEYAGLVAMLGGLLGVSFVALRHCSSRVLLTTTQHRAFCGYLLLCFVLPMLISRAGVSSVWLILAGIFPVVAAGSYLRSKGVALLTSRGEITYSVVNSLAVGLLIVLLYATAWSPTLRFGNDFSGLPEYTLMSDGTWVENSDFLQKNFVFGHTEIDPCQVDTSFGLCIHIPRSAFANAREAFGFFPSGSGLTYNWEDERLRAYRAPTPQECLLIEALMGATRIDCAQSWGNSRERMHSSRVAEFLEKNKASLGAQAHLGRFFFHHAYLYLPVLQAVSSDVADAAVIPSQYGTGLTLTFANLLKWFGGHSFQDYFIFYWVGPGLYVVLIAVAAFLLTRHLGLAASAAALVIAVLPFSSLEGLRLAPGFNPWRHLPDLLCFLAIGLHASRPSAMTILLRAGSFALLLWWNREFGLFMLAGSLVWHFMAIMQGPERLLKVARCVGAEWLGCAVVFMALRGVGEPNDLSYYNLLGVGAPLTRWREVFGCLVLWLSLVSFVAWARFRPSGEGPIHTLDIVGVGFCYGAFASIYGLWNPSPGHFSVVWVSVALPFICLLNWSFSFAERQLSIPSSWLRGYASIVLTAFALITGGLSSVHAERSFERLFDDHRQFEWQFQGIAGRTTADPEPLRETLDFLRDEQPDGALTLISRYDVLLHTASGRLSRLPYVDLPSAVIGWPVIDSIVANVERAKPEVIFIDRDIFANREWQLLSEEAGFERSDAYRRAFRPPGVNNFMINKGFMEIEPMWNEPEDVVRGVSANYHRIGHLSALAMLAYRITSSCYEAGPAHGLLQVWYRHCEE